ncbi:MAG: hypothetical protein U5L10_03555 [Candidatus Moranbacteria bacterium]|nr:hypothetical protein [Candidatus Moranbacteria bacterium]
MKFVYGKKEEIGMNFVDFYCMLYLDGSVFSKFNYYFGESDNRSDLIFSLEEFRNSLIKIFDECGKLKEIEERLKTMQVKKYLLLSKLEKLESQLKISGLAGRSRRSLLFPALEQEEEKNILLEVNFSYF